MVFGGEGQRAWLAPAAHFDVGVFICAYRHAGMRQVGQLHQDVIELGLDDNQTLGPGLLLLGNGVHFGHGGGGVFPLGLEHADLLAVGIAAGLHFLGVFLQRLAFVFQRGVGRHIQVGLRVLAGGQAGENGVQVLAQQGDVKHGCSLAKKGGWQARHGGHAAGLGLARRSVKIAGRPCSCRPSPWAAGLGIARASTVTLDALSDERGRREEYWRTKGALRAAAALVATLFVFALVRQHTNIMAAESSVAILDGNGTGLVPVAKEKHKALNELSTTKDLDTSRLAWIDGERRPGRIALEILGAIAAQSNPNDCPVFLQSYKLKRQPGLVTVEIEGHAEGNGKNATDTVLHNFERGLIKRYLPIVAIKQLPKPIDSSRQQFHYILTITDQPA